MSVVLFVLGLVIHYAGWKLNKQLWSPSYVFLMAGTSGLFLSFFYAIMDFTTWQPFCMKRERACGRFSFRFADVVG